MTGITNIRIRYSLPVILYDTERASGQVAGHETLVKALVSVLFEQGRHDEALEWKKFSQEIVTNHNRDNPSRGTARDVHNFAQATAF